LSNARLKHGQGGEYHRGELKKEQRDGGQRDDEERRREQFTTNATTAAAVSWVSMGCMSAAFHF